MAKVLKQLPSMTRPTFLLRMIKDACKNAWEGYKELPTIVAGAIALALLVNRPLAKKLTDTWEGTSPWWCLAVLGGFVVYGLIQSCYRIADAAESECDKLKDLRDRKIKIGEFLREGRRLGAQKLTNQDELPQWVETCNKWLKLTTTYLKENWPEKLAFFEAYDKTAIGFGNAVNEKHNNALLHLNGLCDNLKEMLGD